MENRELNQAAFDKVVRHLRKQGEPSYQADGESCAYRGEDGRMCAVGCLIPDEQYSLSLEDRTVAYVMMGVPALSGLSHGMLDDLREVHDNLDPDDWEAGLRSVAADYGLTMPSVEEP